MEHAKRKALQPALKIAVWEKYIGSSLHGVCFVCATAPITFGTNVEYGHVIAVAKGGEDTVENLRPICASCNRSMGTRNLLEYRAQLLTSLAPMTEVREIARNPGSLGRAVGMTFAPS